MKYDPFKHHLTGTLRSRRSIRVKEYDYSRVGAYFITIVTRNRECLFGDIVDGTVQLSPMGQTAYDYWYEIPHHFPNAELDEFVVMPNHVHGVIIIANPPNVGAQYDVGAQHDVGAQYIEPLPRRHQYQHIIPKSIGSIVRTYKSSVTRWCNENGCENFRWQRNYHEHIVRNQRALERIRPYIANNSSNWNSDDENPTTNFL